MCARACMLAHARSLLLTPRVKLCYVQALEAMQIGLNRTAVAKNMGIFSSRQEAADAMFYASFCVSTGSSTISLEPPRFVTTALKSLQLIQTAIIRILNWSGSAAVTLAPLSQIAVVLLSNSL